MVIHLNKPGSYQNVFINGDITGELHGALDNALSYFVANYERTPKYQKGEWDGKEHLLKRSKNGSYYFPVGLTSRVEDVFDLHDVEYELNGFNKKKTETPTKISDKYQLRDYQIEALENLIYMPEMSGIIALPTAAGKTMIALTWAKHLIDIGYITDVLVIVHRIELLNQWRDEIKEKLGFSATLIGGQKKVVGDEVFTVAMVQTLYREKQREPGKWSMQTGLLIYDEVHTAPAKAAYSVGMAVRSKFRLGLSATPKRMDGADLKLWAVSGCISSIVDVESLVDSRYIAAPIFELYNSEPTAGWLNPWDGWHDVYTTGIVNNYHRNKTIADKAHELMEQGRQVYIHVNYIDHGKTLEGMINGAVFLSGQEKKDNREKIIADYKKGKIPCLVSTLLKEGVSIDGISALIYAAGGKSDVSVIQTIGRALRMDEKFGNAIIIDFVDSGHKFLTEHSERRIRIYREIYGDLFQY